MKNINTKFLMTSEKSNPIPFNFRQLFVLALSLLIGFGSQAQNPAAGKAQRMPIALIGGTIHVGDGSIIENGTVIFDKGIITTVGNQNIPINKMTKVIDVKGKHVYPGLIAPNAQAGLNEIGSIRATQDYEEIGNFNPNIRTLTSYNTDAESIPTIRGNGIMIGQATPEGGIISGTSSIMNFDGWNWEDAVLKADDGVWMNWPSLITQTFLRLEFRTESKPNEKYMSQLTEIKNFFEEAKAYSQLKNPNPINYKLEAMKGLFTGDKKLYVNVNEGKEIIETVLFAKKIGVKNLVIVGAEEAELAMDILKDNNIAVLVSPTHRLPNSIDEDVWQPYKLPNILAKKGILTGIYYTASFWRTRNLPFIAGTAAAYGLDKEEALKMITLNNAKILGIDKQVGTIAEGKQATIVVSKGDILDMRTNQIEQAYINGKEVNLDDKQKRLYQKYSEKYGIEK